MNTISDPVIEQMQNFQKDALWFNKNYNQLREKYGSKFVAIKDEYPIDSDSDMESLAKRLKQKNIDPSLTFIGFITEENKILM